MIPGLEPGLPRYDLNDLPWNRMCKCGACGSEFPQGYSPHTPHGAADAEER